MAKRGRPRKIIPETIIPGATTLTWLGEDGVDETTWNGVTFPKGKAVPVTDETMIRKARGNRFFVVEG